MDYAATLSRDHKRFIRALDDSRGQAEAIRRDRAVDRDRVMSILTVFFGPVGDAHVDREKVLFRDVERRTPNATRAVSTAIGEVTLGRNHLRRVAHYLDSAVGGDPASLAEVAENLHSAEKVLRKVIALEEDSLLSLIESGRDKEGSTDLEVEIQKIDDRHRKMLGRVTCRRIASVLWA